MNRAFGTALPAALATLALALGTTAPGAAPHPASAAKPKVQSVTFSIRHRVFHDFRDMQTVRVGQDFILGDTDFSARVVRYVPEFEMDLTSRKVISRSDQPRNPAFQLIVRKGDVPQDTAWAFLNMPPHFGRKSYFAFHVIRIDFLGHAPMIADTVAAPTPPATSAGSVSPAPAAPHPASPHSAAPAPGFAPAHRDTAGR